MNTYINLCIIPWLAPTCAIEVMRLTSLVGSQLEVDNLGGQLWGCVNIKVYKTIVLDLEDYRIARALGVLLVIEEYRG